MKIIDDRDGGIDSLRGLSILLVVMYHYTFHYDQDYLFFNNDKITIFSNGWIGVDIFFLVSGYCIAMTIQRSQNFYLFITRRFSRLYPAYFFCGAITLIFYYYFSLPGREVDLYTGIMNLFLLNFIPGLNYTYIDGIYWALAVEAKFYIFFGLIYFLNKDKIRSIYYFFIFCVLGNIILHYDKNFLSLIFSIFPHANIFLLGICIYYKKKLSSNFFYMILIFQIFSLYVNDRYEGVFLLLLFSLILSSLVMLKKIKFNIVVLRNIGLYSYAWYLIHNAVGIIIIRELNIFGISQFSIPLAIAFTLLLATCIFYIVEKTFKIFLLAFFEKIYQFKNLI